MNLQDAKDNLQKEVRTPSGKMILYGINLLPDSEAIGLIFYGEDGQQIIFFAIDCYVYTKE